MSPLRPEPVKTFRVTIRWQEALRTLSCQGGVADAPLGFYASVVMPSRGGVSDPSLQKRGLTEFTRLSLGSHGNVTDQSQT